MKSEKKSEKLDERPPLSLESSESENIALAINEAKYQLRNHTASAQVICHYLKLATTERALELEKLKRENELLEAKATSIRESAKSSESAEKALEAFKRYSGSFSNSDEIVDDDSY